MHVNRSWDGSDTRLNFLRNFQICYFIFPDYLNIDRCGQSKVQYLRDHIRGLIENNHVGQLLVNFFANFLFILFGRLVIRI